MSQSRRIYAQILVAKQAAPLRPAGARFRIVVDAHFRAIRHEIDDTVLTFGERNAFDAKETRPTLNFRDHSRKLDAVWRGQLREGITILSGGGTRDPNNTQERRKGQRDKGNAS